MRKHRDGGYVYNAWPTESPRQVNAFSPKATLRYPPSDYWLTVVSVGQAHRFSTVASCIKAH
ncbi:MAG: hypothetical protein MI751_01520 [Pseudomonadales bacterium]|nr:hypothetical protein [Pseudomonadales bacterium]MED5432713.1 hypothetical protein [Pseudomonadota bacterium]